MNKNCICFIIDTPILQSYRSYYVFDAFIGNGYCMELLDVSPITNIKAYRSSKKGLIDYSAENVHLCRAYQDIYNILGKLPEDTLAITSFGWQLQYYPIFKYLSARGIRYGHMILNSCYETAAPFTFMQRIANFLKQLSFIHAADVVFRRMPPKWFQSNACSFIINNSPKEIDHYRKRFNCDAGTKFLVVHSNMYEEALVNKGSAALTASKYCLWLDSYIPYHPDLAGMNIQIDPDRYYSSLRKFFRWVEDNYGISVIVAAHPRSDYHAHPESYEGFRVIKFNTCILVRDAEFVITSSSTSFLYAVTYQKPMVFIYNDVMEQSLAFHVTFIGNLCREFEKIPINIDKFDYRTKKIIDDQLKAGKERYLKCIYDYIKQDFDGEISGESYKDTIIKFLNEI